MEEELPKEVSYLTSPKYIRGLTKRVASSAMESQGLRQKVADHFGVPVEKVDDQLILAYRNIPPQDEMKDEVV